MRKTEVFLPPTKAKDMENIGENRGPTREVTDYNVSVHGSSLLGEELIVTVTVPRAVTVCLSA